MMSLVQTEEIVTLSRCSWARVLWERAQERSLAGPNISSMFTRGYWPVYPVDFALTGKGAGASDPICKWKGSKTVRQFQAQLRESEM